MKNLLFVACGVLMLWMAAPGRAETYRRCVRPVGETRTEAATLKRDEAGRLQPWEQAPGREVKVLIERSGCWLEDCTDGLVSEQVK